MLALAMCAGVLMAAPSAANLAASDAASDGHENYHVHALAVTPDDTILAFTEGRHELSDSGPKDVLLRRSTDGGETWEPSQVIVESGGKTWGNPTALVDEQTGDAYLFYQGPSTSEIWYVKSSDSGASWDEPTNISDLFDDNPYGWLLNGAGPGHGIQLDDGRLILPILHRREVTLPASERRYGVDMLYSDDHGDTWQRGGRIPVSPDYPINESRVWQRGDGALVINGRAAAGGHRTRISSVSTDGGMTWSDPVHEPATGTYTAVDTSVIRHVGPDGVARVLHSRPDSARRENLTVAVSYDEGNTYRYEKIVNSGPSYYSDLAVLSDGTIVMLYGRDGDILAFPGRVAVARFDLDWLTDGRDTGSGDLGFSEQSVELGTLAGVVTGDQPGQPDFQQVTSDESEYANHADVIGDPIVVDGVTNNALELATSDHLQIPRSDSLEETGDTFTAATWFRTEDASSQAIMWAYGLGSSTPQWWARLEPGNGRIRALVDSGYRTQGLIAPGDYADGEWHHLALTQSEDTFAIYVDGQLADETESPFGSAAAGAREGVHIGQRPDGANPLTGAVDEFYLIDRALSAGEVAGLAATGDGSVTPDGVVVHLPMESVRPEPIVDERPRVISDDNARDGSMLSYQAAEPGDFVEVPFKVTGGSGDVDVAVRYHRYWDRGKIQVSIDGHDLPAGAIDPSLAEGESYQTYQLGSAVLDKGWHRIRFTLTGAGRSGGTVVAPDNLTLTTGNGLDELVRDTVTDDETVGATTRTGAWGRSTGVDGHPYYGVSYRFAPPGGGERIFEWRPDVAMAGTYNVLAWYVSHPNRASDAPYTINHADGSATVHLDQRGQARSIGDGDRPGVWVNLGSYRFDAGEAATIELTNDADGYVIADAVRLTRDAVAGTPEDVVAGAVSASEIEVSWTASEGATDYHIERREAGDRPWEFAGSVSGSVTSFDSTGLAPETSYEHRVYAVTTVDDGRPAYGSRASEPVGATTAPVSGGEGDGSLMLSVLSGASDTVTGDDALIGVEVAPDVAMDNVTVEVNGIDATDAFAADENARTLSGVVTALHTGDNVIVADAGAPAGRTTLIVTNHPRQGPVFSGPHQQPFACGTAAFTLPVIGESLGAPDDEDCSITTRVDYFYATDDGSYAPWPENASSYPDDLATTTTSDDTDAPFIVRMETGTLNRAIYQITVLHDPLAESEPGFDAQPMSWNGAAIFTLGGGCRGGWYRQGTRTGGVTDDFMLGQGYAVMSSTLNSSSVNCQDVTAAETAMMVKERFIEQYGPIDHTVGYGASGGAYQAHQITDNYPGIFDGIIVGASFPEVGFGTVNFITDAWLLDTYFTSTDTAWAEEQQRAVTGFQTYATATNVAPGARRIDPRAYCTMVPLSQRYDPVTNPTGVRCGVYDHAVNVYGRNPDTGFARRPMDNVGVQYGLEALNEGTITREQFLDLNEHVGGFDDDANIRPERTTADLDAVRIAYQTGRLTNGGGGLAAVPIIDWREYRDDNPTGDIHVRYHTMSMRERLQKANGTTANHVSLLESWRYGFSTNSPMVRHAITQMDQWLANISADSSDAATIDKIAGARPADLVEGCNTRDDEPTFIAEPLDGDPARQCEQLYPTGSFPRAVAGESVAADVIKCTLKEPDPADYVAEWTVDEWAQLEAIFDEGVCDYSKPGVEQQGLADTWLRY
jgi:hypothetical protein